MIPHAGLLAGLLAARPFFIHGHPLLHTWPGYLVNRVPWQNGKPNHLSIFLHNHHLDGDIMKHQTATTHADHLVEAWAQARPYLESLEDDISVLCHVGEIAGLEDLSTTIPEATVDKIVSATCHAVEAGQINAEIAVMTNTTVVSTDIINGEATDRAVHVMPDTPVLYHPWGLIDRDEIATLLLEADIEPAAGGHLDIVAHSQSSDMPCRLSESRRASFSPDHSRLGDICSEIVSEEDGLQFFEAALHDLPDGRRLTTVSAISDVDGTSVTTILQAIST